MCVLTSWQAVYIMVNCLHCCSSLRNWHVRLTLSAKRALKSCWRGGMKQMGKNEDSKEVTSTHPSSEVDVRAAGFCVQPCGWQYVFYYTVGRIISLRSVHCISCIYFYCWDMNICFLFPWHWPFFIWDVTLADYAFLPCLRELKDADVWPP